MCFVCLTQPSIVSTFSQTGMWTCTSAHADTILSLTFPLSSLSLPPAFHSLPLAFLSCYLMPVELSVYLDPSIHLFTRHYNDPPNFPVPSRCGSDLIQVPEFSKTDRSALTLPLNINCAKQSGPSHRAGCLVFEWAHTLQAMRCPSLTDLLLCTHVEDYIKISMNNDI